MATNFQKAYDTLNSAQKIAVDTIDGPVLVVAGPGTGKTQLLSVRVANILQRTDTSASSILCLTFTNFAASNMRDRLNRMIGSSAHHVLVRTFHSFAAEIMSLYPDYFWNGARLSIAPDATQIEIIQTILGELPLDNPLASRFAGNLTALNDVQKALKLAKEGGLTPGKLSAMLSVNEAYIGVIEPTLIELLSPPLSAKRLPALETAIMALPDQTIDEAVVPLRSLSAVIKESLQAALLADDGSGKTTYTGTWKKRWIQNENGTKGMFDEHRRNAWWQSLAEVYESYRSALHLRGYYDYSDMIIEVTTQLEQSPDLLASVQERFLYVLIDEFQDTNAAQLRLAHLVATHYSNADQPNLMAVGDDDQSIFAFNGAELNNMLTFKKTYPATKIVVLEDNYRSTQNILNTSRAIIEQAEDRLVNREPEVTKNLRAINDSEQGIIEHVSYPTRDHELQAIAKRIKTSWNDESHESLAVLARSHDSLRRLSSLLTEMKVPIQYEQQSDILEADIVRLVSLLAETVNAIASGDEKTTDHYLSQLLRHPVWQISPTTLWKLAVANYQRPHWLDSLLNHEDKKLVTLGEWLIWLAQQTATEPLPILMEYLLGLRTGEHLTSPIREHYLSTRAIDTTYLEALSGIQLLTNLCNEFTSEPVATLDDFVRFIRLNHELGRAITDQSWFVTGERAVQLMTVHKSKGLEFDVVYVLDAVEDNWQPHHGSRKPPANLPLQPYGEQYDDYVRLLYVAATRAKHSLIVSSYYANDQGRQLLATPLITNVLPGTIITTETAEESVAVLESALRWPRLTSYDEKALLQTRLDNFYLSATGLIQFLNVADGGPQQFLERQLLRLPEATSPSMAYGTAVHAALQKAQQCINAGQPVLPTILTYYGEVLSEQHLHPTELARFLPHGQQLLDSLFIDRGFTLPKGGQAEVSINNVMIPTNKYSASPNPETSNTGSSGLAQLGGKLDHYVESGGNLLISDYKTGKPLGSFTTRAQGKVVKAWQHRTQLLFYTLLARRSARFPNAKTVTGQMLYVEAETAKELRLQLTPTNEDLERVERLAIAIWEHVTTLNLPDITNYSSDIAGITAFEDDLIAGTI